MTLSTILDILGSTINKHLVIYRSEKILNTTFKGAKELVIEVWEIGNQKICRFRKCKVTIVNTENKESIIEELEKEILKEILQYYYGIKQ